MQTPYKIVNFLEVFLEKLYTGHVGISKIRIDICDGMVVIELYDHLSWVKAAYQEQYDLWFITGCVLGTNDVVEYNPERMPKKVAESMFALFMRQKTADVGDNLE